MKDNVLSVINKLEGYKVAIKNLHWSAENMSEHKLCDDIASSISDIEDKISETAQGLYGQISKNEIKPISYKISTTKQMLVDLLKDVNAFYNTLNDKTDVGLKTLVEELIQKINQFSYLITLCIKEDFKHKIKRKLTENKFLVKEEELRNIIKKSVNKVFENQMPRNVSRKYYLENGVVVEMDLSDPTYTVFSNNKITYEVTGEKALRIIDMLVNKWRKDGGDFEKLLDYFVHKTKQV